MKIALELLIDQPDRAGYVYHCRAALLLKTPWAAMGFGWVERPKYCPPSRKPYFFGKTGPQWQARILSCLFAFQKGNQWT